MDTLIVNDESTITSLILGGITVQQFVVYFVFALFGLVCSMLIELYKNWKEINTTGGFSLGHYIRSNAVRVLLSILIMIAGILFSKQLIGLELGNFTAFLAGFTTDKVIDSLVKRKS